MVIKTVLSLLFLLFLFGKSSGDPVLPGDHFVEGWTKSGAMLRFIRSDLYDYIDGAADLFHDFGFEELRVQGYEKGETKITLEVYRMKGAEAALGIYLMKAGKETPIQNLTARSSGNRYQFTLVKGSHFIQVNNFQGEKSHLPVMMALAERILASIPEGSRVSLLDLLPKKSLVPGSELIILGPQALQGIFTFGKGNILRLGGKVFAVAGDYEEGKNRAYTRILVRYPDGKMALSAFQNLLAHLDPYLKIESKREKGFVFQDFRGKFGTAQLDDQRIEIKVNLSKKPDEVQEN